MGEPGSPSEIQPVDYRDDELELADDDDPEADLLDDLDGWDEN